MSEERKTFDPLKGIRSKIVDNAELFPDWYGDLGLESKQKSQHAAKLTREVWRRALNNYENEGKDFKELKEKLDNPELRESVLTKIIENTPNPKGLLGKQSILMTLEISEAYLALLSRLTQFKIDRDYENDTPPALLEGHGIANMNMNGYLKDKLSFLTPYEHRYAACFSRALKSVGEVLELPETQLLNWGELFN